MTLEDLAVKVDGLAARTDIKIEESVGSLAIIVQKGFAEIAKQEDLPILAERVKKIEERLDGHDKEFKGMHQNFDELFQKIKEIKG